MNYTSSLFVEDPSLDQADLDQLRRCERRWNTAGTDAPEIYLDPLAYAPRIAVDLGPNRWPQTDDMIALVHAALPGLPTLLFDDSPWPRHTGVGDPIDDAYRRSALEAWQSLIDLDNWGDDRVEDCRHPAATISVRQLRRSYTVPGLTRPAWWYSMVELFCDVCAKSASHPATSDADLALAGYRATPQEARIATTLLLNRSSTRIPEALAAARAASS